MVRKVLAGKAIAPATVEVGGSAFDAQQFLASVASHAPPDLVYLDRQLLGTYAARGTLEPLTDCIAKQRIDVSRYRPAALKEVTLDGKVYGLPEFYDNRVLLVNDAAVAGSGFTPRDLTDGHGRAETHRPHRQRPVADRVRPQDPGVPPAVGQGQRRADAQRQRPHRAPRRPAAGRRPAVRQVADRRPGRLERGEGVPGLLRPAGAPVGWVTGSAWVIPAGSTHKEQACAWIKTMTDAPAWIAAGKAFTGVYTGNRVADQEIFGTLVQLKDRPAFDAAVRTVLKAQESAFTMPASPAGSEFKTAWQNAVDRVLSGEQQPAEALRQAQQEAQRALDAAR
ncbi:hypothetical protein [Amycolatopsis tolypomycina]|uniref:hypothetical protein n=1 Tax=Amycolatopsis tolypomycina TaxID=208445 RepID=UPI0033A41161